MVQRLIASNRSRLPAGVFRVAGTIGFASAVLLGMGCVSVRAPERISINSSRPEPVDSRRVPQTSSHEQARMELNKAYQNIQYLENQNRKLERDAEEYKRERDDCRRSGGRDRDDD